jgi:hypothetical protein
MRPVKVKPSLTEKADFRLWTYYKWMWVAAVGPYGSKLFKRKGEETLYRSMRSIMTHASLPKWKRVLIFKRL